MSGETPAVREAMPVYAPEAPETERVPPGYKQTEVGVIPEDWTVASLDELAQLTSSCRIFEYEYVSSGVPFLRGKEVSLLVDQKPIDDFYFISEKRYNELKSQYGVPVKGDILITAVGTLANIYVVSDNGRFYFKDGNLIWLRKIEGSEPKYIAAQLGKEKRKIVEGSIGSSQRALTIVVLKSVQIPVPALHEQRAIAAALSDVDDLISALDNLISKKRAVKTAAMQQLLTGKQRLPGFSGEWSNVELGELGSFSKGRGIRKDEVVSNGIPCVRYGEIYTLHHDHVKKFHSFIPESVAQDSQRISRGDLLFTGSGETVEEIGKCVAYLNDQEAYAGGDIVIFSPVNVDPIFLGYLMNHSSVVAQKSRMGQGDAVVHISASNLARLSFALPLKEEQTAIAGVLSDMDVEIEAQEARREKTRQVKQGMMQELLTGRTRLV